MNTNQEQLERVANLLKQAGAVLETIDLTPRASPAEIFGASDFLVYRP